MALDMSPPGPVGQADPPDAAQRMPFPRHIPFVEKLGLELWAFGDGKAELRLDVAPDQLNYWAVAHGGVVMTLLDVAMAHAARSGHVEGSHATRDGTTAGPGVATIEMKTSFMRPAHGRLRALGLMLHKTATMAFTEGRVFDGEGQLCAHATGTFKFVRALTTASRSDKDKP